MNEALDAAFQLDECTIIHEADDFSLDARTHWILFGNRVPWIRGQLFNAEGDAFFLWIKFQYHNFEFFSDVHDLGWMIDTSPCHIADVKNPVDAAQIHQ